MAMRDLMEAECGRAGALARFTSHFVQDHGRREAGLRRAGAGVGESEGEGEADEWSRQFVGELAPQSFRMDALLQDMRDIEASAAAADPAALADDAWAEQYLESGKRFDDNPSVDEVWSLPPPALDLDPDPDPDSGLAPPHEEFQLGFGPHWADDYLQGSRPSIDLDENWSDAATKSRSELQETASHLLNTAQDPGINASKFMRFMQQIEEGKITIQDGEVVGLPEEEEDAAEQKEQRDREGEPVEETDGEAASTLSAGAESNADNSEETIEYSKKLWNKLQQEWEQLFKDKDAADQPWVSEFSDYYDPFKDYPFEEKNPMKDHTNAMEEGKKRLQEGDLASAVLCFEAAVKQDMENSEAWELLGIAQAENEQDPAAIAALKHCLKLDPSNLKALMALAVSYTNESYENQACLVLKEWLRQNKDYSHLVPSDVSSSSKRSVASSFLTPDTHKEVQDLYIAAARLHPKGDIDPDVQCGLGVLFNLSHEYDKAVDCFKTALQVRHNDARMWNRLGATLANGNRSVEAVEAYDQALRMAPGYTRARYNLGITCLNLGAYKEAAEHLITALNQQAQAKGVENSPESWVAMSDGIWSTLRLVVSLLDRRDLHSAVDSRNVVELNKAFNLV